jgi:hypothetical protein
MLESTNDGLLLQLLYLPFMRHSRLMALLLCPQPLDRVHVNPPLQLAFIDKTSRLYSATISRPADIVFIPKVSIKVNVSISPADGASHTNQRVRCYRPLN